MVEIEVVSKDLPDLIELRTVAQDGSWSAASLGYVSPLYLIEASQTLLAWTNHLHGEIDISLTHVEYTGASLKFMRLDRAGHVLCNVSIAKEEQSYDRARVGRMSLWLRTEVGFIVRFSEELIAIGNDRIDSARLKTDIY